MIHNMIEKKLYNLRYNSNKVITLTFQKCEFFECFRVEKITIDELNNDTFFVNSITFKFDLEKKYKRSRIFIYIYIYINILHTFL